MTISTRKHGYRSRKNALKLKVETPADIEIVEVNDPKQMPERYIVLPREGWQAALDSKREKLLKRGLRVVEPVKLIRLHYIIEMIDTCVELEKVE